MASILEQYRISDFIEWFSEKKLVLNPDFQRGEVWSPAARTFLIDTILNDLPIPKIYLRTRVDSLTKKSFREVVDGQQRLRAIIDFANDKFSLSSRSNNYHGLKYSTLDEEAQRIFLSYPIAVGQLLNATDDDVLEVFARLNSYSIQLNAAEKRHAKYQGEFKWAVRNASRRWKILWDDYNVVSVGQRLRMLDDSLMAEMLGIILDGVTDGGQPNIDKLYQRYDNRFSADNSSLTKLDATLEFVVKNFAEDLKGTSLLSAPHFLMLFAAAASVLHGIPVGGMGDTAVGNLITTPRRMPSDLNTVRDNLLDVAYTISSETAVAGHEDFWSASKASTHRIASRKVRFPIFYNALANNG